MADWKVIKGDSSDVKRITIKGITDYTDYRGDITILDQNRNVVGFTSAIEPDIGSGFTVGLSPTHTSALDIGTYIVVFEISKGIDPVTYRREMSWAITVAESLINN